MNDQTPGIERYRRTSIDGPKFFEYQGLFRKFWGLDLPLTGNPECATGKWIY